MKYTLVTFKHFNVTLPTFKFTKDGKFCTEVSSIWWNAEEQMIINKHKQKLNIYLTDTYQYLIFVNVAAKTFCRFSNIFINRVDLPTHVKKRKLS